MDGYEEIDNEQEIEEEKHDLRLYQSPYLQDDLAVIPEDLQEQDTLMSELSERFKGGTAVHNLGSTIKSITSLQSEVASARSNQQNSNIIMETSDSQKSEE